MESSISQPWGRIEAREWDGQRPASSSSPISATFHSLLSSHVCFWAFTADVTTPSKEHQAELNQRLALECAEALPLPGLVMCTPPTTSCLPPLLLEVPPPLLILTPPPTPPAPLTLHPQIYCGSPEGREASIFLPWRPLRNPSPYGSLSVLGACWDALLGHKWFSV